MQTHNYSLHNKRGKQSKRSLENAESTQHFLVCVRSRRAVLGTGRNRRVLGAWGIKKGGERVLLLSGEGRCSKQWLPSVGTKSPKRGQEGTCSRVLSAWVLGRGHWYRARYASWHVLKRVGRSRASQERTDDPPRPPVLERRTYSSYSSFPVSKKALPQVNPPRASFLL